MTQTELEPTLLDAIRDLARAIAHLREATALATLRIIREAESHTEEMMLPPPPTKTPDWINDLCKYEGYTEPFYQDGYWWVFPPNGVMPIQAVHVTAAYKAIAPIPSYPLSRAAIATHRPHWTCTAENRRMD